LSDSLIPTTCLPRCRTFIYLTTAPSGTNLNLSVGEFCLSIAKLNFASARLSSDWKKVLIAWWVYCCLGFELQKNPEISKFSWFGGRLSGNLLTLETSG
jgi:hypothetical protein